MKMQDQPCLGKSGSFPLREVTFELEQENRRKGDGVKGIPGRRNNNAEKSELRLEYNV